MSGLDLHTDEKILFWVRKHWFAYLNIFFRQVLLGVIILPFLIIQLAKMLFYGTVVFEILLLFLLLYLLGIWWIIFVRWIDEDFDCLIITTERVLNTDQQGLFTLVNSGSNFSEIQDVKGIVSGFWQNIFQVGTLEVQTAARDTLLRMENVSDPAEIANKILAKKNEKCKVA